MVKPSAVVRASGGSVTFDTVAHIGNDLSSCVDALGWPVCDHCTYKTGVLYSLFLSLGIKLRKFLNDLNWNCPFLLTELMNVHG